MTTIRIHYLDALAIVKLLIDEDGMPHCGSYMDPHATWVTTSLCLAETLGALKTKHVHKHISAEQYLAACEEIMAHIPLP